MKARPVSRVMALAGSIIARLIGLNALVAAVLFALAAGGQFDLAGVPGDYFGDPLVAATGISVICAGLALVFLFPHFASGIFRERAGLQAFLWAPLQVAAAIFALGAFAVAAERMVGGAEWLWLTYTLTLFGGFFVLFIFPGAAAHRAVHERDQARDDLGGHQDETLAYRILDTEENDSAAKAIEERRQRLIHEANRAAAPREWRLRNDGMNAGHRLLLRVASIPVIAVIVLGGLSRFMSNFLPTAELSALADKIVLGGAAYMVALSIVGLALGSRIHSPLPFGRNKTVAFLVKPIFAPLLSFLLTYPAVSTTAPWLHAAVTGGPLATARVIAVERNMGNFWCPRSVMVRVSPAARAHSLCFVDEDIWTAIRPGEPLFLTGVATKYGLRYHEISR